MKSEVTEEAIVVRSVDEREGSPSDDVVRCVHDALEDVPGDIDEGVAIADAVGEERHLGGGIDELVLEIGRAHGGDDTSSVRRGERERERRRRTHPTAMS